jgi:hypothetical protein
MPIRQCAQCGQEKTHHANGLCYTFYNRQYKRKITECQRCNKLRQTHTGICTSCFITLKRQEKRNGTFLRKAPISLENDEVTRNKHILEHALKYRDKIKRSLITWRQIRQRINKERIDVCNWCRRVAGLDCPFTQWHHDENKYDVDNLAKYTIELCGSCHSKESKRLGPGIMRMSKNDGKQTN